MNNKHNHSIHESVNKFYERTRKIKYLGAIGGFLIGMKICDLIFYDSKKHQITREIMEDQFWQLHGQPKHLKPELVQSFIQPNRIRKSWIQIKYGKDKYIAKPQQ